MHEKLLLLVATIIFNIIGMEKKLDEFSLAAHEGNTDKVLLFLSEGRDVNAMPNKVTPLMGCSTGKLETLGARKEIAVKLIKGGALINLKDQTPDGMTALHLSILEPTTDMTELLLSYNAYVDIQDHHGDTPLHYVHFMFNANPTAFETLLLKYKASQSIKNNKGYYPTNLDRLRYAVEAVWPDFR